MEHCDTWSIFNGVGRYLNYCEIIMLSQTCHSIRNAILDECNMCTHISRSFLSSEIESVLSTFKSLKTFDGILYVSRMNLNTVEKMIHKWPEWEKCFMSTSFYTPKAFKYMLYKIKNIHALSIMNLNVRQSYFNVPIHLCLERNLHSLHLLEIQLPTVCDKNIHSISKMKNLQHLFIHAEINMNQIASIANNLPPCLKTFDITNTSVNAEFHANPVFLHTLNTYESLETIAIYNCIVICNASCSNWETVLLFCEHTNATSIKTNMLRADSMHTLIRRGIKHVCADVIGTPSDLSQLLFHLPQTYEISICHVI